MSKDNHPLNAIPVPVPERPCDQSPPGAVTLDTFFPPRGERSRMECPRCGSSLDRYVLRGREAVGCVGCGYVGVTVEHRGADRTIESWNEAIDRLDGADPPAPATVETADDPVDVIHTESGTDGRPRPPEVRLDEPSDPPAPVDSWSPLSFDGFQAKGSSAGRPSSPEDLDADSVGNEKSETAADPTPAVVRVNGSNGEERESDSDSDAESESASAFEGDLTPAIVRAEGRAE